MRDQPLRVMAEHLTSLSGSYCAIGVAADRRGPDVADFPQNDLDLISGDAPMEGAGLQRRDGFSDVVLSRGSDVNLSHGDDASLPAGDPNTLTRMACESRKGILYKYYRCLRQSALTVIS